RMSNRGWFVTASGSLRNFTHGEPPPMLSHRVGMAASVSAAVSAGSAAAPGVELRPVFPAVAHPATAINVIIRPARTMQDIISRFLLSDVVDSAGTIPPGAWALQA